MILTIANGEISRTGPTLVTIDLVELRNTFITDVNNRFYNLDNWFRVTLNFESSIFKNQSKSFIFNITPPAVSKSIYVDLSPTFIGDIKITSITVFDKENGYLKFNKVDVPALEQLNSQTELSIAPISVFEASSDLESGSIPLVETSSWVEGWKVRLYDLVNDKYLNGPCSILSIDSNTGLITLSPNLIFDPNEMVLESPNGSKYAVTVGNDGALSTQLNNSLAVTNRFNLTEERTGDKWVIKVDNNGNLFIETAILDDLDLFTADHFKLISPDDTAHRLAIRPIPHLQTDQELHIDTIVRQAPNGNKYAILVRDDGVIYSQLNNSLEVTGHFSVEGEDNNNYQIMVDNSGVIYFELDVDNTPPEEGLILLSPNEAVYEAILPLQINYQPSSSPFTQIYEMILEASSGDVYSVTVDTSGVLKTELNNSLTPTDEFCLEQETSGIKHKIIVSNDGVLGLEVASGPDLSLPVISEYYMKDSSSILWKMVITSGGKVQMQSGITIPSRPVIQSQNGSKYEVSVNNNGFLLTELNNSLTVTPSFAIEESGVKYIIRVENDGRLYTSIATGAELLYPVNNLYYLLSPDLNVWTLGIQNLPQLNTQPLDVRTMVVEAPNGDKYKIDVDDSGNIFSELNNSLSITPRFTINEPRFNERYVIKVDNSGTVYFELATGDDLLLPNNNNYQLASTNYSWRLVIASITELHTDVSIKNLMGYALRFAYVDEVTLDQLQLFKFD
jgi:hypothetical protein